MPSPSELIPAEAILQRIHTVRETHLLLVAYPRAFLRRGHARIESGVPPQQRALPCDFAFRLTLPQRRTMRILLDYQNHEIRLTAERLAHVHEHPEMLGLDAAIAETLLHPAFVI